jgi:MFS family permease
VPSSSPGRLSLLRRSPSFGLLVLASVGSGFGTYLAAIALSVDIYDRTGSGKWLAALLIADFLPIVLIGLTLGPLVDRLSRRRLMIVSDLVRAAVFCALPFVGSPAAIVVLAGVSGVATGFFRPAVYAGLPNLVDDEELPEANSLLAGIENVAWMTGPIVGGVLLTVSGPDLAYWINAVTFVVSAGLVSRIPGRKLQSEESLSRGHWRDVRDGLALVRGSLHILTVLLVWNVVLLGNAAVNVAEVVYAKSDLGTGNVGLGILVGATGLGLTVGSFLSAGVLSSLGLQRAYAGSILLMGVGWGLAAFAPSLYVAVPLVIVSTIGNGCALVCNQLLLQRGAPDRMRGRALAVVMATFYATLGLGMAAAGPLTDALGGRWMWGIAGCVYLVGSVVAFAMVSRIRAAGLATEATHAPPLDVAAEPVAVAAVTNGAATDGDHEPVPAGASGFDRLVALLGEVEQSRSRKAERSA